jgi:hypothetical protein
LPYLNERLEIAFPRFFMLERKNAFKIKGLGGLFHHEQEKRQFPIEL